MGGQNMTTSNWVAVSPNNESEQVLERRALLFDRITSLHPSQSVFRNALLALWYPCFDAEAIDLALRQLTTIGSDE